MRNKTLAMKLIVCCLVLAMLFVTGCGSKTEKKKSVATKQEENKDEKQKDKKDDAKLEEEKELPIISNDGDELILEEDVDESTEQDTMTDDRPTPDVADGEKEPEKDLEDSSAGDSESNGSDGPIEMPFVPVN